MFWLLIFSDKLFDIKTDSKRMSLFKWLELFKKGHSILSVKIQVQKNKDASSERMSANCVYPKIKTLFVSGLQNIKSDNFRSNSPGKQTTFSKMSQIKKVNPHYHIDY